MSEAPRSATNRSTSDPVARLTAVFESAPIAMIMVDAQGSIVMINSLTEQLFGYTRENLIGEKIETLVPERLQPRHPELRTQFFASPESRRMGAGRDLFARRRDGSEFPVEIGLNPISAGGETFVLSAVVDITERKRLEGLFRATVDSAPTAMVMIDTTGSIVLVNTMTEQLFGYSRDDLVGEKVEVLVPERFRPGHPELRTQFFDSPKSRRMGAGRDLFARRHDGSEFPVEIGLNPVQVGDKTYVLSAVVDITERKRLESLFRATVDSAPTAMVMIDGVGSITLVNSETEKLFGYSRDELIGRKVEVLVPERFRPQHPELRTLFFADPHARRMGAGRDLFGLRRDGTEFPVEIGLNPVHVDGATFVLSAIVDLTERKRLGDLFRATVESAPTAMIMIDDAGSIALVNSETEKLFGYSRDELIGHEVEVLVPDRFRPQHPGLRSKFFASPEARRMGAGRDLFGLRRDGSEFPVEIGLNPVQVEDKTYVLSAIVDITERKGLEVALHKAKEDLEARVEARTAQLALQAEELRKANEAFAQSNQELQRFAYITSHDLQSPLRSISGFVQLLKARYADTMDEQSEDWMRRIVQSTQQMQTLIRDVLAYSRVDVQPQPFKPIAFRDVFADACQLLQSSIEELGARVTCDDDLPTVLGDRTQLVQLLQNLIGNGLKYHGEDPPRVHLSIEKKKRKWIFCVRDSGIGIDPEYHKRIFELFRRLHDSQVYPGTGIGLAICRRVVVRHGGRIWLESEPGRGSSFYFTLPERKDIEHE